MKDRYLLYFSQVDWLKESSVDIRNIGFKEMSSQDWSISRKTQQKPKNL